MPSHIRGIVEFEKILPDNYSSAIETTRMRMSVQQLLDTQESVPTLINRLREYITHADMIVEYLSKRQSQPLVSQPLFEWSVDDIIIQTPCWRIETILPRVVLAQTLHQQALQQIQEGAFKDAHKTLLNVKKLHSECYKQLLCWKWKLQSLNHFSLQAKWHTSMMALTTGMEHLCTLCVGISNQSSSKVLYTISQRAMKQFGTSVAVWSSQQTSDLLQLSECLRYYYSSDILWDRGEYGGSIYRLQQWTTNKNLQFGPFGVLENEMGKIQLLLYEREQTNNGAYFETVIPSTPLCTITDLINNPQATTDIPHPSNEQEQSVPDDVESTLAE